MNVPTSDSAEMKGIVFQNERINELLKSARLLPTASQIRKSGGAMNLRENSQSTANDSAHTREVIRRIFKAKKGVRNNHVVSPYNF